MGRHTRYNAGRMRVMGLLGAVGLSLLALGCAGQEREWMKVNQPYTAEEFRRDYAACTKGINTLDEACMKSRGWVSVSPGKVDTKPPEPQRPAGYNR